jgi:hypothetical protein
MTSLTLNRRFVCGLLLAGLLVTVSLGISVVLALWLELKLPQNFFRVFDMDLEANLPTWFSSVLMFAAACLLWAVAHSDSRHARRWRFLAFVFLCMSIDETAQLHETLGWTLKNAFQVSGLLHFAWVLLAIPFVAFLVSVYWRVVWSLPLLSKIAPLISAD